MARFLTLKEQLESQVASRESWSFIGNDWFNYTEADAIVFAIDAKRWPRMIMTHSCYQAFKDIVNDYNWDTKLLAKARKEHPEWLTMRDGMSVVGEAEFIEFAKAIGGLTTHEAMAMFCKNTWYLMRAGLTKDE